MGSVVDDLTGGNDSGSVAYGSPDSTASLSGGVVNTAASPLQAPPDASGGAGSFLSSLQSVLTQGLTDVTGQATDYAIGALNDRIAVNAAQATTAAAAPATKAQQSNALFYVALGVGAFVVILIALSASKR